MNLSAAIYAARWLVRDTFRQSHASGLFWLMLGVSGLCILFCLSVGVTSSQPLRRGDERTEFLPRDDREKAERDGIVVVSGELTFAFDAFRVKLGRDAADASPQM